MSEIVYFGVNMMSQGLEEGQTATIHTEFQGTPSLVYVVRGRGGMPLPTSCSAIMAPIDVRVMIVGLLVCFGSHGLLLG